MTELVSELALPRAIRDELCRGFHAEMALAAIRQKRIGIASHQLGPARPVEGLGQPVARIDPDVYYRMRQKFGADCWKDAGFMRSFLTKNPEAQVKTRPRRTVIIKP